MNKMIRKGSLFAQLWALMILATSCCQDRCGCPRPQVMVSREPCIIDYEDCFREYDVCCRCACHKGLDRGQLTDDMFNPYLPIDDRYTLSVGDVLEVSVFGEEETAIDNTVVAPDGNLYYTVLEGVPAAGRTPSELAQDLSKRLERYFVKPIVTVVPKYSETQKYQILGKVRAPGEYPIDGPITLREAILQAGGTISEAEKRSSDYTYTLSIPYLNLEDSFMVRGERKLPIDFTKLLLEGDESLNIYMRPGDYIYIAGSEEQEVFILGYVNGPQRIPYTYGMTLMSALASAGGWPTASPYSPDLKKIVVIRDALTCPRACEVNLHHILTGYARDLNLRPGDIVYASHKQFRLGRELVHIAIDSFIDSFVISTASHFAREHWFDWEVVTDDSSE